MKGAYVEVEKITDQIHEALLFPKEPIKREVFDMHFSQLACQALVVADIIITLSDAEHKLSESFKKMVLKIK